MGTEGSKVLSNTFLKIQRKLPLSGELFNKLHFGNDSFSIKTGARLAFIARNSKKKYEEATLQSKGQFAETAI